MMVPLRNRPHRWLSFQHFIRQKYIASVDLLLGSALLDGKLAGRQMRDISASVSMVVDLGRPIHDLRHAVDEPFILPLPIIPLKVGHAGSDVHGGVAFAMGLHSGPNLPQIGVMSGLVLKVEELLRLADAHQQYKRMSNKCELVRSTCRWVSAHAKHVRINHDRLPQLAQKFKYKCFNEDSYHDTPQDPQTALLQLFILDSLNFCFWPIDNFEYEQLATHVQKRVKEGVTLQQLTAYSQEDVVHNIFQGLEIPLADERARILREVSQTVIEQFDGSFVKLITAANKSAVSLLGLLTKHFPNFQDHSVYRGHQIHFYKRAQILIGDIYGKFGGKGLGEFTDIAQLTMFPDYRVPQVLDAEGVFEYSPELREAITHKREITDREWECELRASSVVAVEAIKEWLGKEGKEVVSIEVDWFLWQLGEDSLASLPPHHRCLTIYY